MSWAPEQVIRYCFQDGAQPLWPAPHCRPKPGDVPACSRCGAARKPEFQVRLLGRRTTLGVLLIACHSSQRIHRCPGRSGGTLIIPHVVAPSPPQVLPQLLHYLRLDEEDPASPDWSTLVAYTCSASCSLPPAEVESSQCAYTEEVVWVQPSVTQ